MAKAKARIVNRGRRPYIIKTDEFGREYTRLYCYVPPESKEILQLYCKHKNIRVVPFTAEMVQKAMEDQGINAYVDKLLREESEDAI